MSKRSRLYSNNHYVFQQYKAPSHTSRVTQAHLEEAIPEFIKKDSLKENVYQGVREKLTKQSLNDRIIMSWEQISEEEMRKKYFCLEEMALISHRGR